MNDHDLVLEANSAFYRAFSKLDLTAIVERDHRGGRARRQP